MTTVTDRPNGRRRVTQNTIGESKTEQAHANEVDINQIVSRYQKTGILPGSSGTPIYGDFTQVDDYQSASEAVLAADAAFMSLGADVRKRFHNNPAELLAFLEDARNLDEAMDMGLVNDNRAEKAPSVPVGTQTPDEVVPRPETETAS